MNPLYKVATSVFKGSASGFRSSLDELIDSLRLKGLSRYTSLQLDELSLSNAVP